MDSGFCVVKGILDFEIFGQALIKNVVGIKAKVIRLMLILWISH